MTSTKLAPREPSRHWMRHMIHGVSKAACGRADAGNGTATHSRVTCRVCRRTVSFRLWVGP